MALTNQPCFRGVAIGGFLEAARRLDAPAVHDALEEHASEALRETLGHIRPRAWYPAQAHLELLDVALHHVAHGDTSVMAELAREAVLKDMRGVYRVLLKVASPSWAVAHAGRFFSAYVNYGTIQALDRTPFSVRLRFELTPACGGLWAALGGAIRATLEAAGADHVRVEAEPAGRPDVCFYRARWS